MRTPFVQASPVRLEDDEPASPPPRPDVVLDENVFAARTVLLAGTITDVSAAETVRRLVALNHASHEPITLLVSSPGGHVESGDAIHNIVRFIDSPVTMIGNGWVGSAATHVFLAVPVERRVCLPHTRFLIHQPSGGIGGRGTDIAIQAREILRIRERIAGVIARETGRSLESVLTDIERDRWLSAEEALDYGLISRIVERAGELRAGG